jgi:predicted NodU family carbamoyl transferase
VKLNQKIIARDEVKELFVQPAASDAGTLWALPPTSRRKAACRL